MICMSFISPGGGELVLIMLALIMLFGAKDAPKVLRKIQQVLDKTQRAAASFRYKIMYGDIQNSSPPEKPYDAEKDYPEDESDKKTPESPSS